MKPLALVASFLLLGGLLAGAQPNAQLDARVSALESQMADVRARLTVVEAALAVAPGPTATPAPTPGPVATPVPTPTPPPSATATASASPSASLWRLVFDDTFDRTVAKGHFMDGSPDGSHTADGRYTAFKVSWPDTSRHGTYGDSSIISIGNGVLDEAVYSDASGWGHTATLTVQPTGGSSKGGLLGARSLIRVRADLLPGFKGVPLWWPDDATNNDMLTYGEIDGPEGPFNALPKFYMHRVQGTSSGDQYIASAPAGTTWQAWHEYVTEWIPGTSVRYFVDGVQVGYTTERIPNTAFHFNLQFETNTGSGPWPAANVAGHIQIDRVQVWSR